MPLTDLAHDYAALRHPALIAVQFDEATGWVTQHRSFAKPLSPPVTAAVAAQAAGEIALGLAALHRLGLTHGAVTKENLRELDGQFTLAAVAQPTTTQSAGSDLPQLAATIRSLVSNDDPQLASIDQLLDASVTTDPETWGRNALATAAELRTPTTAPTAAATETGTKPTTGVDLDTARRRTRNRMIIAGTIVIIAGAVVLRQIDNHGIVKVSNVVGDSQHDAVTTLTHLGLHPIVHGEQSAAAEGTVIAESPKAGTSVRPGRTIILQIAQLRPDTVPSKEGHAQ